MTLPEEAAGSLRSRVMRGVAWTTGAAVSVQASRLLFGLVLARLLTPHEYGIAGMALVFSTLILGVSDFGLGAGLVQRPAITEADRSTVFWTSLGIGVALAAAGVALAGPLASFFGEPEVRELFAAVSLVFVVTALGRAHAALLQRDMAFRVMSVRLMAATVVGGATGIVLAALGYGAWALVGMHVANGLTTTALMWLLLPWRPRFMFSPASLRDLGGFGFNVLGFKVLEYLQRNTDKVLVGRTLGSSSLGLYSVGYNFVVVPYIALLAALVDVLFPAMSRVQHDRERITAAWLRPAPLLVALCAPGMLGLAVVAPDFVAVLLGQQWLPAAPVIQVIAVAMAIHSITAFNSTVMTAMDRTGTVLRFTIVEVVVIVTALVIGLQWGIVGVAAGYLAAVTVMRVVLAWLTARTVGISLRASLAGMVGVLQAALVMTAAVWAARRGLVEADVPAALRLAAVPLIGALIYLPFCAWRCPELVRELPGGLRIPGVLRRPSASAAR
jgi:O-antigen/teichoic acid export membrane protein